jgi:glycine/sarcosine N-methyltransferase
MTEYDDMDWLYDVLYASFDEQLLEDLFIEEYQSYLLKDIKILDASCGNGVQTAALAQRGYNVEASDISKNMVSLTNERLKKRELHIKTFVSSWKELPKRKDKYDLIFCYGNSISHSLNKEERINNLEALGNCLRNKGKIIIETRNWDKIHKLRYTIYEERTYKGKSYIPIYIWDNMDFEKCSNVQIIFIENDYGKMKTYEKILTFMPFKHTDIVKEAHELGFTVIEDNYSIERDNYCFVIAR